jgi:hypothetical protein
MHIGRDITIIIIIHNERHRALAPPKEQHKREKK